VRVERPSRETRAVPTPADLVLLENDPRIVELLSWFLRRRGHRVRQAASFAELRSRLRERAPDLLLSDVELGAESARAELPRLAAEGLLPPTLVVSGYLDRELSAELCAIPGVIGVLAKPFEFQRLEVLIHEHLEGRRAPAAASAAATSGSERALAPPRRADPAP